MDTGQEHDVPAGRMLDIQKMKGTLIIAPAPAKISNNKS